MTASPSAAKPRQLRLSAKLLFVGLASLVGLELMARVLDWKQGRSAATYAPVSALDSFYEPHPFLGFTLKPHSAREAVAGSKPGAGYSFRINSHGFRGKEFAAQKPAGVVRIVCVGGSTTYGTGATRDHLTYPAQLERMLNEASDGARYEVINCGTPGYSTVESLINLELRLLDLQPDAVIVYHAANDSLAMRMQGFKGDYSHLRTVWTQTKRIPLDDFLLRHVRLYAWATRGIDPDKQESNLQALVMRPDYQDLILAPNVHDSPQALATFERNLRSIAAVGRSAGVEVFFSSFGTRRIEERPILNRYVTTIRDLNKLIATVAEEERVPLLDVAGRIQDKPELFDDWMHLNDAGEVEHAKAVYEDLKAGQFLGVR